MKRLKGERLKVLEHGKIEDYLLDDDVLQSLCWLEKLKPYEEKVDELVELRDNTENIKDAANKIRKKVLAWGVKEVGEKSGGFLCDTLAPLIKPGMPIYNKLKQVIFDNETEEA